MPDPAIRRRLIWPLALVVVALLVGACGDDDSPGSTHSQATGNAVDRAFVKDMVAHHESAVQMAQIAQRRGTSAFVKQLADDIVRTQKAEIAEMREADRHLEAAGVKVGALGLSADEMGMDHDAASLNGADPFDRAFMQMMIPHHEGALVMSEAQLRKGGDQELKALARAIVSAQRREISAMREQLGGSGMAEGEHGAGHSP